MNLAVSHMQFDGKQADIALVQNAGHRLLQWDPLERAQRIKRADDRMPGKGNFLRRCKDTDLSGGGRFRRREDEHGLREIHLPGDLLEFLIRQLLRIRNHGNGIAAEREAGKHIRLVECEDAALALSIMDGTLGEALHNVNE